MYVCIKAWKYEMLSMYACMYVFVNTWIIVSRQGAWLGPHGAEAAAGVEDV